jgi:hypothetical protein
MSKISNDKIFSLMGIFFTGCLGFLLSGCAQSLLLTQEKLQALSSVKDESTVVYYDQHYTVNPQKQMFVTTHRVQRVGDNVKSAPDYFSAYDGSTFKLLSFEGRVLHTDGSSESYSKGDLASYALSSSRIISESHELALSMNKSIASGDLIEAVELHEVILPELGILFSPSDIETRARNINWSLELPFGMGFHYRLLHDSLAPTLTKTEGHTLYRLHWDAYVPSQSRKDFDRINPGPILVAVISKDSLASTSWREFGDWYLDLINKQLVPDDSVTALARQITAGKITNLEKLNAIFDFCQKNIRYEQVYLAVGEFIPNMAPIILRRKYGDCKDYATLIHTMAHCVGIPTNLVLCYRGRGKEFCKELPVSQFNHMIVHYNEQGVDYWYDGTNRIGLPGITTLDLVHAEALIIEHGNSRIITIPESEQNNLDVRGELAVVKNSLKGSLTFVFSSQYAIDLHYREFYFNHAKMQEAMLTWLRQHVNKQILVSNLSWKTEAGQFVLTQNCEIPNAVTQIASSTYTSIDKLFPDLLPEANPSQDSTKLYYYPTYNRISIDIAIPNARMGEQDHAFHLTGRLDLPPGPFRSCEEQHQFLDCYRFTTTSLQKKYKLTLQETP